MLISANAELSVNVAFSTEEEAELFAAAGWIPRSGRQAWWTNRHPKPYENFDGFLDVLRVKNAQTIRKQRLAIQKMEGLKISLVDGSNDPNAVEPELMEAVFNLCYASTQERHGNIISDANGEVRSNALNKQFFEWLAERFAHRVLLVLATQDAKYVGGALCFVKGKRIYGRYWGYPSDSDPVPYLHFECCYYMLIEYAIRQGFTHVEPGNGGGHIFQVQRSRGFEPVWTPSYHYIPRAELCDEVRSLESEAGAEAPSWTLGRKSAYAPRRRPRSSR